ncbi:TonB-dependent receptor domain-containing protein [Rhodoferax sp. U11-2br]|uniref:TonB-dependent receptor domain-containing protein n=1 Tax=Rhodoferax sp. U11-2br TaxID=2838878 RepID=UPI001BE5AE8F|nr:TonB-dependent receptor [Rhodoferax sp. U11-2br]MBT3066129.1 TonB-dependent receptor [Rhodoferax sp. U11-2br]
MKLIASCVRRGAPVRLCASALAVLVASPVLAQSQAQGTLDEVVVTATRVAVPVTDVIADVSIIDRQELDLAGQSSLKDVLAFQPGVQITSSGGYRSATGVFLRGASSSQAIVLIDGVRVGSATLGTAAFENMPLDRIERIEILRGAASALYGPDAVGGVIQIFTREPEDGFHATASVGAGSDGQRQASASLRGRDGAIGYSLGLSKEKATGITLTNSPVASSYNPDKDSFEVSSVDAKFSAQLSKQHLLSLSLMHSEMDYQFDGTSSTNPLGLTKLTTDAWTRPVLNLASLKWDAQWAPDWKSSLTLASSDDESVNDYYRYSDGALNGSSRYDTHRTQASWQNDINLGADVLTVLLETRSEEVESSTNYTVKKRDINSGMLSYALNQANWNALAVVRHDDNSQFGGFDNWAFSGGYKLSSNWRAVASLGTSFQAPTFNQLYYPGYGSTTVTPQRNRASELGLKYQQGSLSAGVVAYHNEVKGFIDPATNTQSSLAVLRGVTLSLQNQVGDTRYAVSYDYADPYAQPSALRLVRVARNVLNFNVNHRMGAVSVFGELKLSSDRVDNNLTFTGRDVLAGYSLLNVGATWKINKDLSLLARINNLTDANYVLSNGYAMPGRNAFVSLSWAI